MASTIEVLLLPSHHCELDGLFFSYLRETSHLKNLKMQSVSGTPKLGCERFWRVIVIWFGFLLLLELWVMISLETCNVVSGLVGLIWNLSLHSEPEMPNEEKKYLQRVLNLTVELLNNEHYYLLHYTPINGNEMHKQVINYDPGVASLACNLYLIQ